MLLRADGVELALYLWIELDALVPPRRVVRHIHASLARGRVRGHPRHRPLAQLHALCRERSLRGSPLLALQPRLRTSTLIANLCGPCQNRRRRSGTRSPDLERAGCGGPSTPSILEQKRGAAGFPLPLA